MKVAVEDHFGNQFSSIREMAIYHNIQYSLITDRRHNNWTTEEILTTEKYHHRESLKSDPEKRNVTDYLGNKFKTMREMCEYHNVKYGTFKDRKHRGLSNEECLKGEFKYIDDKGNKYHTERELADALGIKYPTYQARKQRNVSKEQLMSSERIRTIKCKDHLGNVFTSEKEMAEFWGITYYAYTYRKKNGWSLEERLTYKRKSRRTYGTKSN